MPIIGLTDRGVAFPQIGSIRKGAPKPQDGKRPGSDLKYFRVEFDESEKQAAEIFRKTYGEEPNEITIVLPFDEVERVWDAWRESYVAGALLHRCDGVHVNYAIDRDSGEIIVRNGVSVETNERVKSIKCILQDATNKKDRCKPVGRLNIVIPALQRMAYLVLHTTSIHDVVNISRQLEAIRTINDGHIAGVPLVLKRKPQKISTPSGKNGKRARREKWLVSIEADPAWVQKKIAALGIAALPELPAPTASLAASPIDRGPSLEELADYDDEDVHFDPDIEWPETAAAFTSFCVDMTVTAENVKNALGQTAKSWLSQNDNDYPLCAKIIYEWLSGQVQDAEEQPA